MVVGAEGRCALARGGGGAGAFPRLTVTGGRDTGGSTRDA